MILESPQSQNFKTSWGALASQGKYFSDCFESPPIIAFKKQMNLKEHLIRAKKFLNVQHVPILKMAEQSQANKTDCDSSNIVYLINCKKDKSKRVN